ncbi:unnamed protein product [Alternaria alternata]|jgi:acyl-CoA-binding protein|uniref:ACB domain-containing protein n=3 Tax=Alternaria sect. Alternaria TaxID=2499237 RepID=A0A4V1WQ76_ALTAL|nr:hypothetical protein AA0114_g8666 [Alternaria tenuissima]RYN54805.1 hypothetical protein AA0118_g8901 [Alternaria tenuissima]RYN67510.1 hypothetical protein AA0117_g11462 [Alternaria alternata]
MADSVDRVFSHALNTVNKIRTGSQKPPSATRLRLYGLYKQAMEGDVDGIMECPRGSDEQSQRAREKWDAWKQQNGLSRTEAKRRYITTLIDTMHKYASPSPDSRELVAELEFVWDQVKSNVPSSSSSSPLRTADHTTPGYTSQHELGQSGRAAMNTSADMDQDTPGQMRGQEQRDIPLRVKSPMSQSEEELEEEEAEIDRGEVFVDAPDSQYNPTSYPDDDQPELEDAGVQTDLQQLIRAEPIPIQTPTPAPRNRGMGVLGKPIQMNIPGLGGTPAAGNAAAAAAASKESPKESAADQKWRKRVEQSLMKMTAEVAALREQLEARRLFAHSAHYRLFRGIWRWVWACLKHVAVDVFILGIVLLWMRRKKDRRLEGAIRVLLGDAVAQMQRGGGAVFGRVRIPLLRGGGRKPVTAS